MIVFTRLSPSGRPGAFVRRGLVAVACLCLGVGALSAASAYRAVNWLIVVPVSGDTFEVLESRGAGATGIWCAAADYARAAGLDGVRKRMYIIEPRGPSKTQAGGIGVTFTTNPDEQLAQTASSYSVSVNRKGENLEIGHAYNFCGNLIDEVFDRF